MAKVSSLKRVIPLRVSQAKHFRDMTTSPVAPWAGQVQAPRIDSTKQSHFECPSKTRCLLSPGSHLDGDGRLSKSTPLCNRGNVACSVNDADDHDRIRERLIINGVGAVKRYAETRRELFAGRAGKRKVPERLKSRLNRADKARRDVLRGLGRQGRPDLGEIGLGCIS